MKNNRKSARRYAIALLLVFAVAGLWTLPKALKQRGMVMEGDALNRGLASMIKDKAQGFVNFAKDGFRKAETMPTEENAATNETQNNATESGINNATGDATAVSPNAPTSSLGTGTSDGSAPSAANSDAASSTLAPKGGLISSLSGSDSATTVTKPGFENPGQVKETKSMGTSGSVASAPEARGFSGVAKAEGKTDGKSVALDQASDKASLSTSAGIPVPEIKKGASISSLNTTQNIEVGKSSDASTGGQGKAGQISRGTAGELPNYFRAAVYGPMGPEGPSKPVAIAGHTRLWQPQPHNIVPGIGVQDRQIYRVVANGAELRRTPGEPLSKPDVEAKVGATWVLENNNVAVIHRPVMFQVGGGLNQPYGTIPVYPLANFQGNQAPPNVAMVMPQVPGGQGYMDVQVQCQVHPTEVNFMIRVLADVTNSIRNNERGKKGGFQHGDGQALMELENLSPFTGMTSAFDSVKRLFL